MWLLPSYARPDRAAEVLNAFNRYHAMSPGVLLVQGEEYADAYHEACKLPPGWKLEIEPTNIGCLPAMHKFFECYPELKWYGLACDDEIPATYDFDTSLIKAAGEWGMANGNDNWQSERRFHGLAVIGGELVRAAGFWSLPGLWHQYHDDVWEWIAYHFRCRTYLPHVLVQHKHHLRQQAEVDVAYRSGGSRARQDQVRYLEWLQLESPHVYNRIKAAKLAYEAAQKPSAN